MPGLQRFSPIHRGNLLGCLDSRDETYFLFCILEGLTLEGQPGTSAAPIEAMIKQRKGKNSLSTIWKGRRKKYTKKMRQKKPLKNSMLSDMCTEILLHIHSRKGSCINLMNKKFISRYSSLQKMSICCMTIITLENMTVVAIEYLFTCHDPFVDKDDRKDDFVSSVHFVIRMQHQNYSRCQHKATAISRKACFIVPIDLSKIKNTIYSSMVT